MTQTRPCIRGCTLPRQHVTDCEDRDECRGCLPRAVHRSTAHLCERCHLRLSASLAEVPGQHALLLATTTPSAELKVRPQPKRGRPEYHPTVAEAPRYIYVTGVHPSSPQEGEPVRIACLDTAQELADLLAEWVEWLRDEHDRRGPEQVRSQAEREGAMRLVHRPANGYREQAGYAWVEPPIRFDVSTAVRWLRANLEWLESMEAIGDMMENLRTVMGQAHALTPWRQQVKALRGIPCPRCHRHTLRQYGGRETVTCMTTWCEEEIPHGRYLIWAREFEEAAG